MIYFSASTGSFYSPEIHGTAIPQDAKEISAKLHTDLLAANGRGMRITSDAKGNPITIPAEPPAFSALATSYLDAVRVSRENILNRLAGIGFAALAANDTASSNAVAQVRQALLDITTISTVAAATTLAQLKAAVQAEINRITAAANDTVRKAFEGESF
ncbi:MAG: hypothetical protein ABW069_17530 [Duganella sp.]